MKKCSICFSDFQKYQLEFNPSPCHQAHKAGAYPPVSVVLSGGESHNFQFFCCYRACSKSLKILPHPFDFYNMICKDYWFYFLFIHAHVNLCMNVFLLSFVKKGDQHSMRTYKLKGLATTNTSMSPNSDVLSVKTDLLTDGRLGRSDDQYLILTDTLITTKLY